MKVICDRAALVDAVNTAAGIVATRTPTPVLKCIKLTASNDLPSGLVLSATDLEVGLRLGVAQVEVEREGEAAIPAAAAIAAVAAPRIVYSTRKALRISPRVAPMVLSTTAS